MEPVLTRKPAEHSSARPCGGEKTTKFVLSQFPPAAANVALGVEKEDIEHLALVLERILTALDEIKRTLVRSKKSNYTVSELAELVGRSPYTVRRWISEGRIEAIRVAGDGPRGRLIIPSRELARLVGDGRGGALPDSVGGDPTE